MAIELVNEDVIKQAQLGDQESIDIILKEYKNLIYLNIRNYFIIGAEQDDLLQEGTIGLLKALKAYEKGKIVVYVCDTASCASSRLAPR